MRKQSNQLFTSIDHVDLVNLTPTVNETLLIDAGHKNFTAAELWNIQRHGKSRIQRRYLF
jgi:hypothetical protein